MAEHCDTNQDLLPGHVVFVNVLNTFYKIKEVEAFQYDTGRESTAIFSSVAINGTSGFINVGELEPDQKPKRHLFQILPGCHFNFRYYFKVPSGTNRFGTDVSKGIGFIDSSISPFNAPNKDFQIWAIQDYFPSIDAQNAGTEPQTPALRFLGYKYELEDIRDEAMLSRLRSSQAAFKHITVGGLTC